MPKPTKAAFRRNRRPRAGRAAALRRLVVLALGGILLAAGLPAAGAGAGDRQGYLGYLVVARSADAAGAREAAAAVRAAGGVVGHRYPQIGVALAFADTGGFADRVAADPHIAQVGASRTARTRTVPFAESGSGRSPAGTEAAGGVRRPAGGVPVPVPAPLPGSGGAAGAPGAPGPQPVPVPVPAGGDAGSERAVPESSGDDPDALPDPHEHGEWWRHAVGADRPGALPPKDAARHTVTAVLDSGVDDTHPDLAGAVDPARSTSCAEGVPDPTFGAWRPTDEFEDSGHGTHVAGIVAAARDGKGAVGIAPGTRIAAVRLLGSAGQYYGENIVCGMLWAADHGARVINDSYFADPWKYNCPENRDQAAVIAAVRRAVAYAQHRGAVVVASAGNDGVDLRGPHDDERSPNDHPTGAVPAVRHLGPECIRLPGQLPGVLRVTALDAAGRPATYSNFDGGAGTIAAPGGDPDAPRREQVVSSWPGGGWEALSGTSMAAAVVSGTVALEASRHPGWSSARLRAAVLAAAGPHCGGGGARKSEAVAQEAADCRAEQAAFGAAVHVPQR